MKLDLGQVVDRYTIDRVLGAGGTAMVYLVRHNRLGTWHALKVLTLTGQSIRDRMEREGRVQAKLNHLNVVAVTDQIDVDGALGLLMEFIDGPSLEAALQRYRLTMGDAETLFAGVLAGVRAAHREGLVHRDLKPANVLLARTADGFVPKVTDFGLAKVLEQDSKVANTRSGIAMGTPSYMAPEQIRDARSVDQRADMWSLGCILYELTTRKRTFPGDEALAIYNAVVDGEFIPPREIVPDVPDRIEQAILGCLQVDPAARIPSCDTLTAVLSGMIQWARPEEPVTTDFTIPRDLFENTDTDETNSRSLVPPPEIVLLPRTTAGGKNIPKPPDLVGPPAIITGIPPRDFQAPPVSAADAPTMSVASRGPGGATPEPAPPRDTGSGGYGQQEYATQGFATQDMGPLGIEALAIPPSFGFDSNDDQETVLTGATRPIDGTLSPFESFDRPARAGMLGFLGGGLLAVGLFGIGVGAILVVIILLVGSVILSNEEGTAVDPPTVVEQAPVPAPIGEGVPAEVVPEPVVAPVPIVAPGTTFPVAEPEPAEPVPAPVPVVSAPNPKPAPTIAPAPAPEPTPPEPVPGEVVTREVTLLSMPRGAEVVVDGTALGNAPKTMVLPVGEHAVQMILPDPAGGRPHEEYLTIHVEESGGAKWCCNFNTGTWVKEACQ